ncbi:MAG TPA: hypothetical protein VMM37_09375, partial [Bacteroidota bacterium]|nr:hypothetical protein [Bacteroidota bacterium]
MNTERQTRSLEDICCGPMVEGDGYISNSFTPSCAVAELSSSVSSSTFDQGIDTRPAHRVKAIILKEHRI